MRYKPGKASGPCCISRLTCAYHSMRSRMKNDGRVFSDTPATSARIVSRSLLSSSSSCSSSSSRRKAMKLSSSIVGDVCHCVTDDNSRNGHEFLVRPWFSIRLKKTSFSGRLLDPSFVHQSYLSLRPPLTLFLFTHPRMCANRYPIWMIWLVHAMSASDHSHMHCTELPNHQFSNRTHTPPKVAQNVICENTNYEIATKTPPSIPSTTQVATQPQTTCPSKPANANPQTSYDEEFNKLRKTNGNELQKRQVEYSRYKRRLGGFDMMQIESFQEHQKRIKQRRRKISQMSNKSLAGKEGQDNATLATRNQWTHQQERTQSPIRYVCMRRIRQISTAPIIMTSSRYLSRIIPNERAKFSHLTHSCCRTWWTLNSCSSPVSAFPRMPVLLAVSFDNPRSCPLCDSTWWWVPSFGSNL